MKRLLSLVLVLLLLGGLALAACNDEEVPTEAPTPTQVPIGAAPASNEAGAVGDAAGGAATAGLPADALAIANQRGLSPADVRAAMMTYMPSGKLDDYYMFASGGQAGSVIVIGVPSMRILKSIAVFTPESWQGYGYGERGTEEVLDGGNVDDVSIRMGDTHHPGLSETGGDYDGQYLFINDKASARIAVIDLRDFETKQIVKDPNLISQHGSTFVTPNTEYVVSTSQYATPLGWEYAPISEYKDKYRGLAMFYAFDREKGRIDMDKSFGIELPPYWQDLCDAGKGPSEGWAFCNSFNSELATGGINVGQPPFEAALSQRDTDYLHIFNWKKAAEAVAAGKAEKLNGVNILRIPTAVEEGVLFLAPEPKSPHGVDVTPDGKYMVVAGKLDPHVTVFSYDKMMAAIDAKNFTTDDFGIPIIDFDAMMMAQVELGLGPLHTQYDGKGNAYTSLFLDSAIAKWTLGGDDPAGYKLLEKLPVQYNVGHISAAEGDTINPDGQYLVALNKWSVDRFLPTGPLKPQNEQLLDIGSDQMSVIYDMPMGIGEPHYAQMIKADKIKAWDVYPQVGWDSVAQAPSEFATLPGQERIERDGSNVEIFMTSVRSHLNPEHVDLQQGDHVTWHITNIESAVDATHGFDLGGQNLSLSIEPGETVTFEIDVKDSGTYAFYCTEFCSALHLEMAGYMFVAPAETAAK